jgi:ketosteroid isomerase-like protein
MKLFALAAILLATLSAQTKPTVADRLQRLEDQEEIRLVLTNYGRFLDARDFASYSRLFAKDGEWIGGFGTVKGPAEIQAFMEKQVSGPNKGNTYHILSNFEIEVHGDTATAWSRWAYITPGADGKPVIAQGGRYDDTLVRENGAWKFQRRTASNDIPSAPPPVRQ